MSSGCVIQANQGWLEIDCPKKDMMQVEFWRWTTCSNWWHWVIIQMVYSVIISVCAGTTILKRIKGRTAPLSSQEHHSVGSSWLVWNPPLLVVTISSCNEKVEGARLITADNPEWTSAELPASHHSVISRMCSQKVLRQHRRSPPLWATRLPLPLWGLLKPFILHRSWNKEHGTR